MKFAVIAELSNEEVERKMEDLKESYMKLRFQHATGQLDSSAKLRQTRRDIAKVNTLMGQRARSATGTAGE